MYVTQKVKNLYIVYSQFLYPFGISTINKNFVRFLKLCLLHYKFKMLKSKTGN